MLPMQDLEPVGSRCFVYPDLQHCPSSDHLSAAIGFEFDLDSVEDSITGSNSYPGA